MVLHSGVLGSQPLHFLTCVWIRETFITLNSSFFPSLVGGFPFAVASHPYTVGVPPYSVGSIVFPRQEEKDKGRRRGATNKERETTHKEEATNGGVHRGGGMRNGDCRCSTSAWTPTIARGGLLGTFLVLG